MASDLDRRSLNVIGKNLFGARIAVSPEAAFHYLLTAVDDMYALLASHLDPPDSGSVGGAAPTQEEMR